MYPHNSANRAYEVLSDEKKRQMYDGGFDTEGQQQQPPPGWQGGFGDFQGFEQGGFGQGFGGFGGDPFESIFEMMNDFAKTGKSGRGARRDVQRGRDITLSICFDRT